MRPGGIFRRPEAVIRDFFAAIENALHAMARPRQWVVFDAL